MEDPSCKHSTYEHSCSSYPGGLFFLPSPSATCMAILAVTVGNQRTGASTRELCQCGMYKCRPNPLVVLAIVLDSTTTVSVELSRSWTNNTEVMINQMRSFAMNIASYSVEQDANWPCVTIPDFERRGELSNVVSGAVLVGLAPVVRQAP